MNLDKLMIQYKDLIQIENLESGLNRTKNNVSPGLDGEVKSDITNNRLQKLYVDLIAQKYKPSPSKKVGIPKPDGGIRYLGIASQIDKVVQGAILNKLEPELEKIFLKESYGFRPNLGCHNALKEIKYGWKGVTWIINIDISKCFDKLNHEYLLVKLEEHCDQATVELIRKLIKVGYVDIHNLNDRSEYLKEGTPQGSLISPILSNLYLHNLDQFVVEELYPLYNRGEFRSKNSEYSKRYTTSYNEKFVIAELPEVKPAILRAKHNKIVKEGIKFTAMNGFDPTFRRLHYVRYADDFILGFTGPRIEAENIYKAIESKLAEMHLETNKQKSKIFHSSDLGIKYLGVFLRYFDHNKIKINKEESSDDVTKQVKSLRAQAINTVHFRAPIEKILKRLVDRGIAKVNKDGIIRSTAYLRLGMLEDAKIIDRFSSIIRGLLNYYSCINHRSDLWKVFSILRKSAALTLAHKYSLGTAARAYIKFGPNLSIKNATGKIISILDYPTTLKTKIDFKIRSGSSLSVSNPQIVDNELNKVLGSTHSNIITGNVCEFDGCEATTNLEAHHLRPMAHIHKRKDLSAFEKAVIQRKRKVIMLCKKHHNIIHNKGLVSPKKAI